MTILIITPPETIEKNRLDMEAMNCDFNFNVPGSGLNGNLICSKRQFGLALVVRKLVVCGVSLILLVCSHTPSSFL